MSQRQSSTPTSCPLSPLRLFASFPHGGNACLAAIDIADVIGQYLGELTRFFQWGDYCWLQAFGRFRRIFRGTRSFFARRSGFSIT